MKSFRLVFVSCCLIALGCSTSKPANEPGPAQKAGAAVDQGARESKESAKEAGKKLGEASEKAGDKLREKSN